MGDRRSLRSWGAGVMSGFVVACVPACGGGGGGRSSGDAGQVGDGDGRDAAGAGGGGPFDASADVATRDASDGGARDVALSDAPGGGDAGRDAEGLADASDDARHDTDAAQDASGSSDARADVRRDATGSFDAADDAALDADADDSDAASCDPDASALTWTAWEPVHGVASQQVTTPVVTMNATGNAMAVWVQDFQGTSPDANTYWSSLYTAGSGWAAATKLHDRIARSVSSTRYHDVAFGPNGNAIATGSAYPASFPPTCFTNCLSLHGSVWTSGGGWATPTILESVDTGFVEPMHVRFDGAGNATVVYAQWASARLENDVWALRYTPSGGWTVPKLLETEDGPNNATDLAVNPQGVGVAVWNRQGTEPGLWTARYETSWSQDVRISDASVTSIGSSVAVGIDDAGNAVAAWDEDDPTRRNVWVARYVVGSGWEAPIEVDTTDGMVRGGDVSVAADGRAVVTWTEQSAGGTWQLWARSFDGSAWGPAVALQTSGLEAIWPAVESDRAGGTVAVWLERNGGGTSTVWANRYVAGCGWSGAVPLHSGTPVYGRADVAVHDDGRAIATWAAGDFTGPEIRAARLE